MTTLDPRDVFLAEASELLDRLETTLLDLGDRPDDTALIDTAFRALHTIKGSGAMFGFDRVAAFTHDFETAFDRVRRGQIAPSVELINVALSAKDYIRTLIEEPDPETAVIGEAILAELDRLVGGAPAQPAAAGPVPPAPAPEPTGWRIGLTFAPDILRNGSNPLALLDELAELGACTIVPRLGDLPDLEDLDPESLAIGWDVTLVGPVGREAIEDVFLFVRDAMTLTLEPLMRDPVAQAMVAQAVATQAAAIQLPAAAPKPPQAAVVVPGKPVSEATVLTAAVSTALVAPAPPPDRNTPDRSLSERRPPPRAASTMRVEAERLDELMDRVGELVIAQARLSQLAGLQADAGIKTIAEEIERLSAQLRDTTMGIRMVPIGTLFSRFRRLVHDLSRDLGKPVTFVTDGEETELDKTVIERLADPLVHLIRNAIDHGVEAPECRVAAGKAETGRIALTAEHAGAQVLVSVRDDGAGLDVARIRAKAEERGLVQPGTPLTDQQVYQFLFAPGFSTAQEISALSGRGVGMDVVKKTIEALRGSIDITTEPGAGTAIVLRLPLTLAIIEGLLIRVGEARYVLPLAAVEECIELPVDRHIGHGRDFLSIRGDLVPFLRLRTLFEATGEPDPHQKVIVVAVGETRIGLVADQILGNHQTVIKSLSKLHADVATFSGATILGDGTAALIIDPAQIAAGGHATGQPDGAREYREVA